MGTWKESAKSDSISGQGPACRQKQMAPGVVSGNVAGQMNPRRERTENYAPSGAAAKRNRQTRRT